MYIQIVNPRAKVAFPHPKKIKNYLIAPTYINYKKYHAAIIYFEPF